MAWNEFKWQTPDKITIYGCEWPPAEARGVVGIIHGLGEHCHRYDHFAEYLNTQQLGVVGYDRRGHGRSGGKLGHTTNYNAFLDEVGHLLVECERRYQDLPVFLYGHSMGGNILLNYLIRRNPDISGAIATGPHIRLAFQPNVISVTLGRLLRQLVPGFTQPNDLDTQYLSRDPQVVEAYLADNYVHNKITAATAIDLLAAARYLDTYRGAVRVPLLLMHGGADGITDPAGTEAFYERVQGADTELKIWEDFFHEIHNEPEREQVFHYVTNWMGSRLDLEKSQRPPKSI